MQRFPGEDGKMMVEGKGDGDSVTQETGAACETYQDHIDKGDDGKDQHDGYPSHHQNVSQSLLVHRISFR
jgi:hypothetical protein